jgi:XTP/dITP diphosphohydrolase
MNIWFASGNEHKKAELAAILGKQLKIPSDAGLVFNPDETGSSFYENALIKARQLFRLLAGGKHELYRPGDFIIADDSGICVDALGGRPGIYSARYPLLGGPPGRLIEINPASSAQNSVLLEELTGEKNRSARFVCAMVLLSSEERFFVAQETLEGEILGGTTGRGSGGFGYDPIFYIPELGKTVAELSTDEKNRISHRAKAGKIIANLLGNRD